MCSYDSMSSKAMRQRPVGAQTTGSNLGQAFKTFFSEGWRSNFR